MNAEKTTIYTIGQIANMAGVNIETIRYYQRIGLINQPKKPPQGYRRYPKTTAQQIQFIKRAQQLGFNLHEVAELLELGEGHCSDVRKRAEKKRLQIENQINDLNILKGTLSNLINACQSDNDSQHCPLVEALLTGSIQG